MPKPESFPIDKIYVPVKRKKALKPELVQEIAESILEIGQQAPILVRPDEGRFVLVEGLHRFEACKALGEKTIIGVLMSAEIVHQKTLLSDSAEAERDKMARLKTLRLEKEAAARLAAASEPVTQTQSAELLREPSEKGTRNNFKASRSQLNRRTSGPTPKHCRNGSRNKGSMAVVIDLPARPRPPASSELEFNYRQRAMLSCDGAKISGSQ